MSATLFYKADFMWQVPEYFLNETQNPFSPNSLNPAWREILSKVLQPAPPCGISMCFYPNRETLRKMRSVLAIPQVEKGHAISEFPFQAQPREVKLSFTNKEINVVELREKDTVMEPMGFEKLLWNPEAPEWLIVPKGTVKEFCAEDGTTGQRSTHVFDSPIKTIGIELNVTKRSAEIVVTTADGKKTPIPLSYDFFLEVQGQSENFRGQEKDKLTIAAQQREIEELKAQLERAGGGSTTGPVASGGSVPAHSTGTYSTTRLGSNDTFSMLHRDRFGQ